MGKEEILRRAMTMALEQYRTACEEFNSFTATVPLEASSDGRLLLQAAARKRELAAQTYSEAVDRYNEFVKSKIAAGMGLRTQTKPRMITLVRERNSYYWTCSACCWRTPMTFIPISSLQDFSAHDCADYAAPPATE